MESKIILSRNIDTEKVAKLHNVHFVLVNAKHAADACVRVGMCTCVFYAHIFAVVKLMKLENNFYIQSNIG